MEAGLTPNSRNIENESASETPIASAQKSENGLTFRALVVAIVFTLLAGLWIRQSEIVALATQVSESIPAIPGLASLVALLLANFVFRKIRKSAAFTRAEMLMIFLFVTVASTVAGIGVTQFLFALMTTPYYFTEDGIAKNIPHLPKWLLVHDPIAIKHLYDRAPDGQVPWHLWAQPMCLWILFFLALWATLFSMMTLFYRAWSEDERLAFPQVFIPLEMTGGEDGNTPFFKNKLMWAGFVIAGAYNFVNIAHALNPSFPAIGKELDLTQNGSVALFSAPPWSEIAPLKFQIRPEMIGLGYLVSTEISLTAWLSYFLMKFGAVIGVSMGVTPGQLPYAQEQGFGAYMTLAILLIWLSRKSLLASWKMAISGQKRTSGLSQRWMFVGLIGGFLAVLSFMTLAGMSWWVALVYLSLIMATFLVYGRLRAEAGVPLVWLFPYYMPKRALLYAFGSAPFLAAGANNLSVWALFTFLARGFFPAVTGYQVESLELGRRANIRPGKIILGLTIAVGLGLVVGWYNHLTPYYLKGASNLREGIWGSWIATPEFTSAIKYQSTPLLPDLGRTYAMATGAFVGFGLWFLRLRYTGFPLHPLGYVMACSYGSLIWGSFLLVWILKSLALRYGGMQFYRRTIPFFLGLALGHFAIAGIFWGLTGAWTGDSVHGYEVFFG